MFSLTCTRYLHSTIILLEITRNNLVEFCMRYEVHCPFFNLWTHHITHHCVIIFDSNIEISQLINSRLIFVLWKCESLSCYLLLSFTSSHVQKCGRIEEQIELLKQKLRMIYEGETFNGKLTKMARSHGKKFQVTIKQETSRILVMNWSSLFCVHYICICLAPTFFFFSMPCF